MAQRPPELYGKSLKDIARICGVSEKTAGRWKYGQIVPPVTAIMIMSGDLGHLDPAWAGWTVRDGALYSPENWAITLGDVLATPFMRQQLAVYQAELRVAKEALLDATLESQPEPGDLPVIRTG